VHLCHQNGKLFWNAEYLRIENGQLESIECYFGAKSSLPFAVSIGHVRQVRYHEGGAPDSRVTLNPRFRNASELITEIVIPVGKWSEGTAAAGSGNAET
jgi:hypothetical protein